ncbi:hypothetical protein [Streptomyces chartreusis]
MPAGFMFIYADKHTTWDDFTEFGAELSTSGEMGLLSAEFMSLS